MKIWITRHGQTEMNRQMLMQGHTDAPLNEHGIQQARAMRKKIGNVSFDAVYSSPLQRARTTAEIIGGVSPDQLIIDPRIIEVSFGKYEGHRYYLLGPRMTLYWLMPGIITAPPTVEPVAHMIQRSRAFLQELEAKGSANGWENVLVTCHGGIMRTLCGYLADRENGMLWRPKPENCEIRVYESVHGVHQFIHDYKLEP